MTKEDFEEWSNMPLTKEFFQYLKDYRDELMEAWADGYYTLDTIEASTLKNIEALAKAQCYKDLYELETDYIENFYRSK